MRPEQGALTAMVKKRFLNLQSVVSMPPVFEGSKKNEQTNSTESSES